MPPLNLIPLLLLRPLRLILSSSDVRRIRIVVLKATHAPFVALILVYERLSHALRRAATTSARGPQIASRPGHKTRPSYDRNGNGKRPATALSSTRAKPRPSQDQDRTSAALSNMDSRDLIELVQTLTAKVDDLAAMVAGQQTS
jgi:hypothetical protein